MSRGQSVRRMAVIVLLWLTAMVLVPVGLGRSAQAHEVKPAVLALKEVGENRFTVRWSPPTSPNGVVDAVPVFPLGCALGSGADVVNGALLQCGADGLVGQLSFDSPREPLSTVSVSVEWRDGHAWFQMARGTPPTLTLRGVPAQANAQQSFGLALYYGWLGVEHIWGGPDHLLFVLGLLLLVRDSRRLLWTITSFTVAHSVTLVAATLGWTHVPIAPVELCIALSVLLLAIEASERRPTFTRQAPWLVAFAFGLLHGLGFASALADVGLPPQHVPLSLLAFNLGVEVGQLCVIGLAAVLWTAFVRKRVFEKRVEFAGAMTLGTAATVWTLQRVQGWLTGLGGG